MFRKNTKITKTVVSVILLGLLIFFGNTAMLNRSRSVFFTATDGVRYGFFSSAKEVSARLASIFKRSELIQKNEALRIENQNLSAKLTSSYLLEEENKILRQALKIKQEKSRGSIIARITGFQRQFRDDFLIIDLGSEDGIAAGDLAVAENNIFIGRIQEVWAKNSRLILSSSASESYSSILLPQNLPVLALGSNNQELLLDLVPENMEVNAGDIVVTSGKGEIFLEGLILGKVISAKKIENQIFQSVAVKTLYDPDYLKKIIIIKK